ncbi:CpaD family pilus assembly lipoprotein [Mesorhizobium sp. CAU 1732]|uniref:CpaD family pilus assembly protein n=1 Tax=Mesorhizobium sp. CAU 1732 TaxID=3140358 RepID=UPI0032612A37
MSEVLLKDASRKRASAIAMVAAVALVTGCANRDSITVGSVPDDYRTNHPIVISEKDKTVDIPVGYSDMGLSAVQRVAVDGFIADYDRSAGATVTILVPHGSGNQHAAALVAADMAKRLRKGGVREGRVVTQPYDASRYGDTAPIRLIRAEMTASTGQCGRWPADMLDNADNKHWANFGCAYQNNLAAQIANPADLLGPRKQSPIDAQNRSHAIDQYQRRGIAADVRSNREVNY